MRSGLWPVTMGKTPTACLFLTLILPFLVGRKRIFLLLKGLTPAVGTLPRLSIASLLLFLAAHALLFRLHLPSRFTQHSFRIIVALAAAMTIVAVSQVLWEGMRSGQNKSFALNARGLILLGSFALLLFHPQLRWAAAKQ